MYRYKFKQINEFISCYARKTPTDHKVLIAQVLKNLVRGQRYMDKQ